MIDEKRVIEATLEQIKDDADWKEAYEDLLKSYKKGDLKATFDLAVTISDCITWGYNY